MLHRIPSRAHLQGPLAAFAGLVGLLRHPCRQAIRDLPCEVLHSQPQRQGETLPPCQCKFWPEIGTSGPRRRDTFKPVQPAHVAEHLRLNDENYWAQADIHLAEILLYGPFDFETRRKTTGPQNKVSKETHFVADVYRKHLEDAAQRRNVDVHDVRQLPPRT